MKSFLKSLVVVALLLAFLPAEQVSAQAGGFVQCSGADCSACNLVSMINTIIIWLFGMIFVLFAILMAVAGFGLVTSGGNQAALDAAKSKFQNALVGIIIVMAGWLIVDTIMKGTLAGGTGEISGYGPWSEVKCQVQTVTQRYVPSEDSTPAITGTYGFQAFSYDAARSCKIGHSNSLPTLAACQSALAALQTANPGLFVTKNCEGTPVVATVPSWNSAPICGAAAADPTADGAFSYQSGIAAQSIHASPALNAMLSCMANIVPGNVGIISSISDSLIVSGARTWAQCRLSPRSCAHVTTSYHYGNGGRCGDRSYAVDFGDESNATVLCRAANSCGAIENCSVHNGNHVHLEIPCP